MLKRFKRGTRSRVQPSDRQVSGFINFTAAADGTDVLCTMDRPAFLNGLPAAHLIDIDGTDLGPCDGALMDSPMVLRLQFSFEPANAQRIRFPGNDPAVRDQFGAFIGPNQVTVVA